MAERPADPGTHGQNAWDPGTYLRFGGERARPFADLLARVRVESPRTVVDLGCGEGALTASLAARWPEARITGIDSSPEMVAAAAAHTIPGRLEFAVSDARDWWPEDQIDVRRRTPCWPTCARDRGAALPAHLRAGSRH